MKLARTLHLHSHVNCKYDSKYTSAYVLKDSPGHYLQDAFDWTRWHTPSLLDFTLQSKLSGQFQVHVQVHSGVL